MSAARLTFAALFALSSAGLGAAACGPSGPASTLGTSGTGAGSTGTDTGTSTGAGMGGALPSSICLLHNCNADTECAACSGGKTTCLASEHRCVACDAGGTTGCPAGQKCSSYGNCAPSSASCPTSGGVPTITCSAGADCAACDPAHQVCDPAAHKCVACTTADVSQCQSTETCSGGDCAPKCPADCTSDGDCAQCGATGQEAHACYQHKCSQCSPTTDCGGVASCGAHGTCAATCGASGQPKGVCATDADCMGCDAMATKCNGVPIGGGSGKCGPDAPGCSELGKGIVLPAPFDQVTNLCSTDADCASVGVDLNVGKMLRDLTGWDQIHDADLMYPEHVCASVEITGGKSCGACVPCKVDSDCQSIDVDTFAAQAFGPLGKIAAAFLLDQIFGPGDHEIHMYCETVADGYGVCLPCPGLLNDCSVGTDPMSSGTCSMTHDTCTAGDPLDVSCGACEAAVCAEDAFCCTVGWDQSCVNEVGDHCDKACESCSQGAMGGHDKCQAGGPLQATCSPCVWAICQADATCCAEMWQQSCIDQVPQYCEKAYLCQGQCNDPSQCTGTDGCLADYTCGPCLADYDCFPKTCDTMSGQCQ